MLPQVSFDAHLQRNRRRRAPHASPMEPDSHDLIGGHLHQFDITAVGLHRRPDEIDDLGDPLQERGVLG